MTSVPPPSYKTLLLLPLFISCWLAVNIEMSRAATVSDAADLSAELSVAQKAIDSEDFDHAEELLRNLLIKEENALSHRLLGFILLKKGLQDAAIAELSRALQIDPHDELTREYLFSIYYNRAQSLLEIPQEAYKARAELENAIAIRPNGIMSYYYLGALNYQEKRDAECIVTLLKVADTIPVKLRGNLQSMLYHSAFNLLNQKRAGDARDVVPYLSTPQATVNELLLTATIALELGDFAKSTELYDRVLHNEPLNAVARHNRDIAQQGLDEFQQKGAKAALPHKMEPRDTTIESSNKPLATRVNSAP